MLKTRIWSIFDYILFNRSKIIVIKGEYKMVLRKEFDLLKHVLLDKIDVAIILTLVITADVLGNIIYEAVIDTYPEQKEFVIEYVDPQPVVEDVEDIVDYEVLDPLEIYEFELTGYIDVNTELNVRSEPDKGSEILTTLTWMDEVNYSTVNDDWYCINVDGTAGYIASKYVTDTYETYTKTYSVNGDKSKTYMDYRKITDRSSKQYRLQLRATTNEENGLRMLRNRFMIAIGSYFGCKVGQYVDVVLSDGEVLNCIVGDAKQDIHTDSSNLHGLNGDTVEFIVNETVLKETTPVIGNISDVSEVFDGKVVELRVYDHIEQ